jgi:hypothetical protein
MSANELLRNNTGVDGTADGSPATIYKASSSVLNMEWIDIKQHNDLPLEVRQGRKPILAKDEYGNIAYVYWDGDDWIYDQPRYSEDATVLPGKVVRYIIVE